jgi:hypothetical protein
VTAARGPFDCLLLQVLTDCAHRENCCRRWLLLLLLLLLSVAVLRVLVAAVPG